MSLLAYSFGQSNHNQHRSKGRKEQPRKILETFVGSWIIESPATQSAKPKSEQYLPSGLHVQLDISWLITRAMEATLSEDEAPGSMTLLSPFPDGICSATIGAWACRNGVVTKPSEPASGGVTLLFRRWSRIEEAEQYGSFFWRKGARAGTPFVTISQDCCNGTSFDPWIKGPNELLGFYTLGDSEAKAPENQIEQIWHRVGAK